MWMVLGIAAIITAVLNVAWRARGREAKYFRFASLSLTALTVCSFYGMAGNWVAHEDWSALMDVVPTMSGAAWVLTILSVLINSISLFPKKDRG